MSSILKALKKVEEEKNARQNAAPLTSDVVKPRRRSQQSRRWKAPAALAAVAVVAVLSTYGAMGGFSSGKQGKAAIAVVDKAADSSVSTAVTEQVQPVAFPADGTPAGTPPQSAPGQKTAAAPLPAVRQPLNSPLIVATEKKAAAQATRPASVPAMKPASITPAVAVRRQPEAFVRTTTGSIAVRDIHAEFKVNGIAWQKESSSRLAVVNGVAVTQGSTIDGAKVVEILPDRVRFSQGGRNFEVVLGKINPY